MALTVVTQDNLFRVEEHFKQLVCKYALGLESGVGIFMIASKG